MSESLKRDVSLAVLKLHLIDVAASSMATVHGTPPRSATEIVDARVLCELQVTGEAAARQLAEPAKVPEFAPSRRKRGSARPSYEMCDESEAARTRAVAQWILHPEEIQLPLRFSDISGFRDRPIVGGWLADVARDAVTRVLNDSRVRAVERFASVKWWLPNGRPTLPLIMARQLRSALEGILHEGDCLWLELAEPMGYLPLLPWEEMLATAVKVPVLRLSPHALRAVSSQREVTVAMCVSLPFEKIAPACQALKRLMISVRGSLPANSALHVFADDRARPACVEASEAAGSIDEHGRIIKVHDYRIPQGEMPGGETWTTWITRSFAGRAVDIVQFYASALLLPDLPRMVVLRDPSNASHAIKRNGQEASGAALRYVSPHDICQFLTQLGAWGATFSLPPSRMRLEQSRMALRLFSDQMGRLRPGVAVFHDPAADRKLEGLAQTYRFMIGEPDVRPSTSGAVSVYCHPSRATNVALEPSLPPDLLQQYQRINASIQETLQREQTLPAWMAAMQRVVENAVSRLADAPLERNEGAALRGVASALKYVDQIFAQRASATPLAGAGGSQPQEQHNAPR